jgi:serine/threonine protein phosphatase 1
MAASRGEEKIRMSMYQRINGADWRNIFVVGDLHGCYTLLMNELEKVSFDPARDLLISVGDLVDRGAENVECLDLITMPWFGLCAETMSR